MSHALDAVLPRFDHNEVHETFVAAPPEQVWTALHSVTASETPLSGLLMFVRGGGKSRDDVPFIERMLRRFAVLVDDAPSTFVFGGAGQPWRPDGGKTVVMEPGMALATFDKPGYALMATSFELTPTTDGRTRLTTETRILATDDAARASFRRYWRVIRPGSGIIRRDLLRAIRSRAERADPMRPG
jgi:hypothetical protein